AMRRLFILCFVFLALKVSGAEADILIDDFEGDSYAKWEASGAAFGDGPARGTLTNQMPVTGFLNQRLVNSFAGGDKSTGALTSTEFSIDRPYINFLIGGGNHPD